MRTLLGHFDNTPLLVAADRASWLASCVLGVAALGTELSRPFEAARIDDNSDGFWPDPASWMAQYRPYKVRGGVLSVPIRGATMHNFGYASSWATGYQFIERAVRRGMSDPDVEGIVLDVNSGGGMVSGAFDCADRLFAMREQKPITAVLDEHAYSAAYLLASVANEITVPRTGGAGSIGVVTMHVDISKMLESDGIKVTYLFKGKHKVDGNMAEPLADDARAKIEADLGSIYDLFVSTVARNRASRIDENGARETEAACLMGQAAIDAGLADRIMAAADSLCAFEAACKKKGKRMSTEKTYTQAELNDACATARREGADAERVRVSAILNHAEAKNRPIAAHNVAMDTAMPVEAAAAFLAKMPVEAKPVEAKSDAFERAMAKANPEVGASAAKEPVSMSIDTDSIYARRNA